VEAFYPKPMLELQGWAQRQPLETVMYDNAWGEASAAAPNAPNAPNAPSAASVSTAPTGPTVPTDPNTAARTGDEPDPA